MAARRSAGVRMEEMAHYGDAARIAGFGRPAELSVLPSPPEHEDDVSGEQSGGETPSATAGQAPGESGVAPGTGADDDTQRDYIENDDDLPRDSAENDSHEGSDDPLDSVDALLGRTSGNGNSGGKTDSSGETPGQRRRAAPRRRLRRGEPEGKAVVAVPVSVINDARDRLRPQHTGHHRTLAAPLLLSAYIRAVHELGLDIDCDGLQPGSEDEAVTRVHAALAAHYAGELAASSS